MSSTEPKPAARPDDARTQAGRLRKRAIIAYAIGVALSLVWGLSYDLFLDLGLQADIHAGATSEGTTYLSIHNGSSTDWNDVHVEVDGAWTLRRARIAAGSSEDVRLREFGNVYRIPRPIGVYYWESVGGAPEPDTAPANLRPSVVVLRADRGELTTRVSF